MKSIVYMIFGLIVIFLVSNCDTRPAWKRALDLTEIELRLNEKEITIKNFPLVVLYSTEHRIVLQCIRCQEGKGDANSEEQLCKGIQEKIYYSLKGKSGNYSVKVKYSTANYDKYGNEVGENTKRIGFIDATELSKFKSYEFWGQGDCVLARLLNSDGNLVQ